MTLEELCLHVRETQREEPGSDKNGRERRSGEMFPVPFKLHLKDELELGQRELWVKAWKQTGAYSLVDQRLHAVTL